MRIFSRHCHCVECGRMMRKPDVIVRVRRWSSDGEYYDRELLCTECYFTHMMRKSVQPPTAE